jgi:hypothetical protein
LSLFSFNFVSILYTCYTYLSILFCVKCWWIRLYVRFI